MNLMENGKKSNQNTIYLLRKSSSFATRALCTQFTIFRIHSPSPHLQILIEVRISAIEMAVAIATAFRTPFNVSKKREKDQIFSLE